MYFCSCLHTMNTPLNIDKRLTEWSLLGPCDIHVKCTHVLFIFYFILIYLSFMEKQVILTDLNQFRPLIPEHRLPF